MGNGGGTKAQVSKVPGPGQYELKLSSAAPKPGFGTSKRPDLASKSKVPGPGNYTVKSNRGKSCGFGTEKRAGLANKN
jgi:hypothetical protein